MSVLIDRIKLVGTKGQKKIYALYDSGASFSFIKKSIAENIEVISSLPDPLKFETAESGR